MSLVLFALLAVLAIQEPTVAVTTTGAEPESQVDSRFGRSPWILIHDPAKNAWEPIDNSSSINRRGSAGVGTAESLVRRGVKVVISGQCGPKALGVLSAAGVKVYDGSGRTAARALTDYRAGRLREIK